MYSGLLRVTVCAVVTLGLFGPRAVAEGDTESATPPIREFDVATASRLGREIYAHDQFAWIATDEIMAKVGRTKLASEKVSGWVVDTSGPQPVVRFFRPKGDSVESAYDIYLSNGKKPKLAVPENRQLTAGQLARYHASRTAGEALLKGKYPFCGRSSPNVVVLSDPEADGLLVYVLRPKESRDEIPIGGHYRVTTTADGMTVKRIDKLFASCLTLSSKPPSKGDQTTALFMSHIVSARPLETHVFLSMQDHIPFMVVTPDRVVWQVDDGQISKTNIDLSK